MGRRQHRWQCRIRNTGRAGIDVVAAFGEAVIAIFGPGVEVRFDPFNNFNAGLVAFQVLALCDIVFPQPSAFVRITSIT